jgi:hypothetical protein
VENFSFFTLEGKKGNSSLHREMERPSKEVTWGEEKFAITTTTSRFNNRSFKV